MDGWEGLLRPNNEQTRVLAISEAKRGRVKEMVLMKGADCGCRLSFSFDSGKRQVKFSILTENKQSK